MRWCGLITKYKFSMSPLKVSSSFQVLKHLRAYRRWELACFVSVIFFLGIAGWGEDWRLVLIFLCLCSLLCLVSAWVVNKEELGEPWETRHVVLMASKSWGQTYLCVRNKNKNSLDPPCHASYAGFRFKVTGRGSERESLQSSLPTFCRRKGSRWRRIYKERTGEEIPQGWGQVVPGWEKSSL